MNTIWALTVIALQLNPITDTDKIYTYRKIGEPYLVATVIESKKTIKVFIENKHPGKIADVVYPHTINYGHGVDEFENKLKINAFSVEHERNTALHSVVKLPPKEQTQPLVVHIRETESPVAKKSQRGIYLFSIEIFHREISHFYEIRLLKDVNEEDYNVSYRLFRKLTNKYRKLDLVIKERIEDWLSNNKYKYTID